MKHLRLMALLSLTALAALSSCAQGMMGAQGYGRRGYGMMGDLGMMGGYGATNPSGTPLGMEDARSAVLAYLATRVDKNLTLDETIRFTNGYYALVKEKDTGMGAFELLVDQYSGAVFGEPGPNMMWNDEYGPMNYGLGSSSAPWISSEDAKTALAAYLKAHGDASSYDFDLDEFYGYYTIDFSKDGAIAGMASVNAVTGEVWYHMWHGAFVAIQK